MTNYQPHGLDMIDTLRWYSTLEVKLPVIQTTSSLPYSIDNPELIELSRQELNSLYNLYPKNAQDRSILRRIIGQPSSWFHQDSTDQKPLPTIHQSMAISTTSIIPSYIDYTPWGELKVPTADIWLYQLPQEIKNTKVRKIVLAEGFLHEFGHSIVQPALYVKNHTLRFPDGKLMNGLESMLEFAQLAENHPPISHYASTYRGPDNKFKSVNPEYNIMTAISEEMCETLAAYFLGFAFCNDPHRRESPFADRPEIINFVKNFLEAELVKE
jgi:hypothetical protein